MQSITLLKHFTVFCTQFYIHGKLIYLHRLCTRLTLPCMWLIHMQHMDFENAYWYMTEHYLNTDHSIKHISLSTLFTAFDTLLLVQCQDFFTNSSAYTAKSLLYTIFRTRFMALLTLIFVQDLKIKKDGSLTMNTALTT